VNNYTDFLYARPSFVEGMSRVLDMSGTLNVYNESSTAAEADRRAIQSDWRAIGADMWIVMPRVPDDRVAHRPKPRKKRRW